MNSASGHGPRARAVTLTACALALCGLVLPAARVAGAAGPVRVVQAAAGDSIHIRWSGLRDSTGVAVPPADTAALVFWRARLASPATAPTALRVLADMRAAVADSAGADSCWRALAALDSPWQWPALQRVATGALAAHGPAAADSAIANADRTRWSDAERAAWLERRASWNAAARDTARAAEFARQLVLAYPGIVAPAARGLALLDSLAAVHGDSLPLELARIGAEIDVFRGARPSAIARLKRVLARSAPQDRFAAALRLAEVLRASRMPIAALSAADTALAYARGPEARTKADLERARALRDAARTDSALALYARTARADIAPALRATAWWEYAREAQDRGRYRVALAGFERVTQLGGAHADDARLQAGLMCFALGAADSARTWWRHARGEGARFWLGVALRTTGRATSDSLLRALAAAPGYSFYRAAARETLGVRGWPAAGRAVAAPAGELPASLADVRVLLAAGRPVEAVELLARYASSDLRTGASRVPAPGTLLAATALAFEAGRPALGTRLAERAFSFAPDDSSAWAIVPWAYPPAWAAEVARAATPEVEPALLWGLARQESRFDSQARSRSDALGLAQLKLATAADVARALREPPPTDRDMLAPDRSLRYGARYLAQLVRRFDGRVPVGLAAYNAGASTIRADWRELIARGGEALYCELASNADSQDYARRITGFRQAYRELRPGTDAAGQGGR